MNETARGRDEERVRLHQRELLCADHAAIVFCQRAGDRHEIGAAHQIIELDFLPADRKSTRLNSSHVERSYAVFCSKKKKVKKSNRTWSDRKQRPALTLTAGKRP